MAEAIRAHGVANGVPDRRTVPRPRRGQRVRLRGQPPGLARGRQGRARRRRTPAAARRRADRRERPLTHVTDGPVPWQTLDLRHGRVGLRPITVGDRRAWREVRQRNAAWLRRWEATRPPDDDLDAGDVPRDGARPAQAGAPGPLPAAGGHGRHALRRPAHGQQHHRRVGAVRQHRLLDRPAARRARASCRRPSRWRWTTAGSASACTGSRSRSGPRTPRRCASCEKLGFAEVGYAPRYLHIDGDWRDHRLFALTVEDVPGGLLRRWTGISEQRPNNA